jgi:hypothetical protein
MHGMEWKGFLMSEPSYFMKHKLPKKKAGFLSFSHVLRKLSLEQDMRAHTIYLSKRRMKIEMYWVILKFKSRGSS